MTKRPVPSGALRTTTAPLDVPDSVPRHSSVTWLGELLDRLGSQPARGRPRQCPAHRDVSPSLSVFAHAGGAGAVLWCHAGCRIRRILGLLALTPDVLWTTPAFTPAEHIARARLELEFPRLEARNGHPATYGYWLEAVHDYPPSWFLERWRSSSGAKELLWFTRRPGGDVPGLLGVRLSDLPVYRETEIRVAMAADETVILVESESSADALLGWYCTTWAGGAGAVQVGRLSEILGRTPPRIRPYERLVTIPDNDDGGRRAELWLRVYGLADRVLWPAPGEDAKDLYERLGPAGFRAAVHDTLEGDA